jgi:Fe-S-cluster containining protein
MPIFYECDRCTACCRWPGQVRLDELEITRLAGFLQISEFDFVQRYTRLTADRQGLALQDKPNGECVFLEGRDCAVNAIKPQQCRDFPNLWNFPGFLEVCRAKAVVMDDVGYTKAIEKATGRIENNSISQGR